jgi:hypothetical protein
MDWLFRLFEALPVRGQLDLRCNSCREGFVPGDIGLVRLPMADRSKPRPLRGQHGRRMVCSPVNWQVGENADGIVLVGRLRR